MIKHNIFQDVHGPEVVCYEKRGQSEGTGQGGSKETARPHQGFEDKIWEVKGRKSGHSDWGQLWE